MTSNWGIKRSRLESPVGGREFGFPRSIFLSIFFFGENFRRRDFDFGSLLSAFACFFFLNFNGVGFFLHEPSTKYEKKHKSSGIFIYKSIFYI